MAAEGVQGRPTPGAQLVRLGLEVRAIDGVSHQGMADMGEVHPDLVRAPGLELQRKQGGDRFAVEPGKSLADLVIGQPLKRLELILDPGLPAASKLVVLALEQNVERRHRSVTARDVLLELKLVRIAQFLARVHLLFEHAQIVPDHHDLVKERLPRHFFRLP